MRRLLMALAGAGIVAISGAGGAAAQTAYPYTSPTTGQGRVCIMIYPPPPGCESIGTPSYSYYPDSSSMVSGWGSYSGLGNYGSLGSYGGFGGYGGSAYSPYSYASLSASYPAYAPHFPTTQWSPYYWSAGLAGYFGPGSYMPTPALPLGSGLGGLLPGLGSSACTISSVRLPC
jgi:hypothetical protein